MILIECIHDWIVGLGYINNIDVVYILILVRHMTVLYFLSCYLNYKTVVSLVNYLLGYLVLYMIDHNVLFYKTVFLQ